MKIALGAIAGLLVLVGLIWILQGLGYLPGSFMTGDRQWAINGAIAIGGGLLLLAWSRRRP